MGLWSIVIPESADVTNLVTNPSAETNTTGWAAVSGGTLAQSSAKQRRGYMSLSYTSTTATGDGIYFDSVALANTTAYAFPFDFWGADGIPYTAYFADTAGTLAGSATQFTGAADWQRQIVTYSSTAAANYRLYVTKNNSESVAAFYVDGVGVFALDHDPGHIDGDQPDCHWTGTPHASTSIRKAGSRAGGEVVNFDDFGFYINEWPGAGMAEVDPLTQEIGMLPGADDAGEKIPARPFSLVGTVIGSSQPDLHSKRKSIIDALKSDRVKGNQQPWIVYSGANSGRPVRVKAKYIGGLTMNKQDGFSEKLALKFLATSPFWHEDGQEGAALTVADTVVDADYVMRRIDGQWYNVNTAFNGIVYRIAQGKDGKLYFAGGFTDVGDANGDYIVSWNGSSLASLGTGLNNAAYALYSAPNGNIYLGGAFTSAGGVANTQGIACWDTSTSGWKEVGGGITTLGVGVRAFAMDNTGNLYVGGGFTNQTDANGDYISCYSSTGWGSLGTGMSSTIYTLAIGPDGYLYAGGHFATGNGVTLNYIGKWTGTTWEALSTGIGGASPVVYSIVFDEAGNLYAGGQFTTAGGVTVSNVAMWNGKQWAALGSGIGTVASAVTNLYYKDGLLYATGDFLTAGGISITDAIAVWNGSTWAHFPVDFPTTSSAQSVLIDNGDLYVGYTTSGTAYTSYKNTLTNSGTAKAYPKFTFRCDARATTDVATVAYLKNETTGATIWLNYALQDGESLTLDFSPFERSVTSSARGNVIGSALLRNSDFADFYLLPGTNYVSVYVFKTGTPTITAYATWPITHWSNDGSAT